MPNKNIKTLVYDLIALQNKYAQTPRAILPRDRYENIYKQKLLPDLDIENPALREPLLEHVGHLPIIASYLHPHIERTEEVDLGRSLSMLSIHDIGETEVGDVLTYKKTKKQCDMEFEAAKKILHPSLHPYLEEYEERNTPDAKFAKSVDALAPLLHEIDMPNVTIKRFKHYGFDHTDIEKKKRPHFTWDTMLLELFEFVMNEYKRLLDNNKA